MAEEAEIIEVDESELIPARASDPGKQALAGLSDIGTGLPMLLGMAGAGTQAGWNTLTGDKKFMENFADALSSGADKWLIEKGASGREAVNKALGIQEPVSTEDQAARLVASVMPIPGLGVLGGASKLAKLARGTANVTTPFVKYTKKHKWAHDPTKVTGKPHLDKLLARTRKGTYLHKGNIARAGTQVGLGVGLEQGIRAAMDDPNLPLMFSERALTGDTTLDALAKGKDTPEQISGSIGDDDVEGGAGDDVLQDSIIEVDPSQLVRANDIIEVDPSELVEIPATQINRDPALVAQQKQYEAEETNSALENVGIFATGALATYGAVKYGQARNLSKIIPTVSGTISDTKDVLGDALQAVKGAATSSKGRKELVTSVKGKVSSATDRIFGNVFDERGHVASQMRKTLREKGLSEDAIEVQVNQLLDQTTADPHGTIMQFFKDGILPQGAVKGAVTPLRDIKRQFDLLNDNDKQVFLDGVAAVSEDMTRNRATAFDLLSKSDEIVGPQTPETVKAIEKIRKAYDKGSAENLALALDENKAMMKLVRGTGERIKPGLFRKVREKDTKTGKVTERKEFVEDPEVARRIDLLKKNPALLAMHKNLAKINEAILDSAVTRGVMNKTVARAWKTRSSTDKDGLMYLPGKELLDRPNFMKRIANRLGAHTSSGKILNDVASWEAKSLIQGGGVGSPLNPFHSTADYAFHVMDHTNRSVKQWEVLKRLSGWNITKEGMKRVGKAYPITVTDKVRYVGKSSFGDPRNSGGNIFVEYSDDALVQQRFNVKGELTTPQALEVQKDVIWVQRDGDFYGFLVADKQLRNAIEYNPALAKGYFVEGNRALKNVFTQLTTGKYSVFGPTSFIYNQTMGSLNAALKSQGLLGAPTEALRVWRDGFVGAWEIFSTKTADDVSQILTKQLASREIGKSNPDWLVNFNTALRNKVKNSLLAPIERETGKSASSLGASQSYANVTDVMEEAIPYIRDTYGSNVLPQFWRCFQHLNTAMQEGTAVGITMRKMAGDVNPSGIRAARRAADDVVGDVRIRGSSETARIAHAMIPFSGAMMQAFSTLGRATKKAGFVKTTGILTFGIGLPTALEVTYNNSLDNVDENGNIKTFTDASGKAWTYSDYYWKGFTVDQRNNNGIVFIPGKPPWEAMLVPIVPEVSFIRSGIIDMMESAFGLSSARIDQGNHFMAGLGRLFDIPFPPGIAAIASSKGLDVKLGVMPDSTDGKGVSFFKVHSLGGGERVTPNYGRNRAVGDEIEMNTANVLQDLFGAAGSMSVAIANAMYPGTEQNRASLPIGDRAEMVFDAIGDQFRKQARWTQPIFGKALRPNPNNDISKDVLIKKDTLQRLRKDIIPMMSEREGAAGMSGSIPAEGNTIAVPQDPMTQQLAIHGDAVLKQIAPIDKQISELRNRISTLHNAFKENYTDKRLSVEERNELIDAYNLRISELKTQQLSIMKGAEEDFADMMNQKLGKDMSGFSFESFEKFK